MELNVLVNMSEFRRVVNLLGGAIVLTGKDRFSMRVGRQELRLLTRNGISYMMADSPMAKR